MSFARHWGTIVASTGKGPALMKQRGCDRLYKLLLRHIYVMTISFARVNIVRQETFVLLRLGGVSVGTGLESFCFSSKHLLGFYSRQWGCSYKFSEGNTPGFLLSNGFSFSSSRFSVGQDLLFPRETVLGIRNLLVPNSAALVNSQDWPLGPGDLIAAVLQCFRASGQKEDNFNHYTGGVQKE